LYGSNATAGVISITTKRGARDGFVFGGSGEGGSNGTYQLSAFMRGGGEGFYMSFSATGRRDGGFDVSGDPGGSDDQDENVTLNGRLNVDLTEALSIGGTFRFTDRESDFDQFNFGAADVAGLVTDANNFVQQTEIFGSVNADLVTFGGRVVHGFRLDYTDVTSTNFTAGVASSDVESERYRAAYQATIALDAPRLEEADHQITLAGEWEREGFRNVNPTLVFDPSQLIKQDRTLFGVAGEYRGNFFNDLDVQFGGRYDINDEFENAFSYSVGVSYFLDATDTRFHGSVGTGASNPTFFEQFGFIPGTFIGNPDLEPETNFGWDIGAEQTFWQDRIVVDVTYFRERLKDEIATPTFVTPVNQTGTSRRQGFEIAASIEPISGLTIAGNYTWLDASNPDGSTEVRRPQHEGGVNIAYSFLEGRASLGADGRFVFGNVDTDFTAPAFGTTVTSLDDYFLLDLNGSYQMTDKVQLTARIENVTDTDYEELDGFETRGITGFAGVRVSF
ncbi:MAG: TonB-dependent receptor, partial [Pseudomonadota bacterium]